MSMSTNLQFLVIESDKSQEKELTKAEKKREYNKNYAKNMSPEQKEKIREQKRNYYKKMTPEQREKIRERQRTHNLTPEQREKRLERQKNYYKNLSPEQKDKLREYDRKYYENMSPEQKEKIRERQKNYFKNMSPEQKEKIRERKKNYFKNMSPEQRQRIYSNLVKRTNSSLESSLKTIISDCKTRAKKYCRDFDLDIDFVLNMWTEQEGQCALSKIPLEIGIGSGWKKVSVDRIDSSQGYVKNNVQLVATGVNHFKLDMTQDDFLYVCKAIASNN